jgi:hypothetical protein
MSGERFKSALAIALGAALAVVEAQAPASSTPSLAGAWTLNKDLSDQPLSGREGREGREGGEGRDGQRNGGYGGGRRGGGFGRGGFGGGNAAGPVQSPEDAQRLRNALRDELQAADHLTIIESGTTLILTAGDGRTTRLSLDGKKIKDESTNVERKTKRDAGKVVSEITGLGRGKIIETYSVDPASRQLHMTLELEGGERKTTVNRVYDADPG